MTEHRNRTLHRTRLPSLLTMVCTLLYAHGPNVLTNRNSSATLTTLTTPSFPHKVDYTKLNTRSKPSSRAQRRSVCALKRMPFSSLSRCVTTISSLVCAAATSPLLLQRSSGELASYQQKMFRIDDHVGIAIAGLTSDARVLRCVSPTSLTTLSGRAREERRR